MFNNAIINQQFKHFEIIEQLKEHIQIKVPSLFDDPERARIFEILLCKSDAVHTAKVSPATASAQFQYDPAKLGAEKLFIHLDSLLAAIGRKVCTALNQVQRRRVKQQKIEPVSNFLITGMACPSCALSLQLLLSRQSGISQAKIHYESGILTIHSKLASNDIVNRVKNAGFKAFLQKK